MIAVAQAARGGHRIGIAHHPPGPVRFIRSPIRFFAAPSTIPPPIDRPLCSRWASHNRSVCAAKEPDSLGTVTSVAPNVAAQPGPAVGQGQDPPLLLPGPRRGGRPAAELPARLGDVPGRVQDVQHALGAAELLARGVPGSRRPVRPAS